MSDDKWGAGDRAKWSDHGTVRLGPVTCPLIYGEHPHSRQDNRHYALMNGEPMEFSGHRIQVGVVLNEHNYLKESELSGDEIRKGGSGQILADGVVVYDFFFREIGRALLRANTLIGELMDHPSGWMIKKEREALVGRKLWYRDHPAVVRSLIVDQGCLMLGTENGEIFPRPAWRDGGDDPESEVKVEVTDPHIWWWR